MKRVLMGLILLSSSNITWAEAPSSKYQECLGRVTFEIPEEMEWATYDASRVWQISKGGGHNFTGGCAEFCVTGVRVTAAAGGLRS
ncbi:hypothetical protein GNQ29_30745 [Pseudomonas aeruginosa]|nr:hypothetical protein [Pseudomonas aeruginosa]